MKSKFPRGAVMVTTLLAVTALGLAGCSSDRLGGNLIPNQSPSVELTNAPTAPDRSNPYFYAYRVHWSGVDPDGRVDHFEFAVDPPGVPEVAAGAETVWVSTPRNEEIVFFRASQPDPVTGTDQPTASDFHVFVIKAVDDDGAESPRKSRAFFSYTIAPTITIRNPIPTPLLDAQVTPSVRIEWEGTDPDGQFSQKPVSYKYLLLDGLLEGQPNHVFVTDPDSLRRREAARNWEGWTSTPADTQFVQFTNLTILNSYMFVVIGFDEAGAYSPIFSLNSNCLKFTPNPAILSGPKIRIFNEFIDFAYQSGGYTTDPQREISIEVPTGRPITVNWEATASPGARIAGFRWMVNGNINDETRRSDEENDYVHWSQPSPTMPNSVILRPFTTPVIQRFYLECEDNNNVKSLGILKMTPVTPSFDRELLIVDDTRLEADKWNVLNPPPGTLPNAYTKDWPSAAELDTFLFARGGSLWKGARNPPNAVTTPGLFAGYNYDTLGTRKGLENPALSVLLSQIGAYKSLVWMLDYEGAGALGPFTVPPLTALRTMSLPGRASTLAAYTQLGGRVWLLGGAAAHASLLGFDNRSNNLFSGTTIYMSAVQFSELGPGRIMWDGAHWQSTIGVTKTPLSSVSRREYTIRLPAIGSLPERDTTYIVAPDWRHLNRFQEDRELSRPDYAKLPLALRTRREANDPVPPTRGGPTDPTDPTGEGRFYGSASVPVEYLIDQNAIIEDVDPDPSTSREISVLDTLYEATSTVLLTFPRPAPVMTYYHGNQSRQFVFTGLPPWFYCRQDCMAMVDFVLQEIWGLGRGGGSFAPSQVRSSRSSTRPNRHTSQPNPRAASARSKQE